MADNKKKRPDDAAIGSGFKEQRLGEISDLAIMGRLWAYMKPYWLVFAVCLVLLPILSGLTLLQPHLLQLAIDNYFVPGEYSGLTTIVLAFGGAVLGQGLVQFLQFYLMQWAGQRALHDLRNDVFAHVQSLRVSFFHKNPIGRLMARMTTDVESLQEALSSGMITMIGDVLTLGGVVVILLVKDWKLALWSFTVLPFLVGLTAIFRHFMRKAYREIRVKVARLYSHLQESISGMPVIQLFVRENVSADEYVAINEDYRDANFQSIRYDALLFAVVETVGSIAIGVIIWYGSGQVLQDAITLGVLVAFIEYMQKFFVPIRNLAQKYNQFQSAIASGERIFQLLDNQDQLEVVEQPREVPTEPFRIEFDDVWFAYNDEDWILRGVSFTIEPGEKLALVGHTGAGKTTITSLLLRLYDVNRGSIRINGVDIREFDLTPYRRAFAVVLQDVFLFKGSIRENIGLDAEQPLDEIRSAAKTVRADKLIARYDDGYDHQIEERGGNLAAGEKQLIAFARALAHKPEVLILDEATANVDTETEALLQEAVEQLLAQQTSVAIAHRLSTIQKADRILVLHKGEVVESGTHEELVELGGHYEKLYRLQYAETKAA